MLLWFFPTDPFQQGDNSHIRQQECLIDPWIIAQISNHLTQFKALRFQCAFLESISLPIGY